MGPMADGRGLGDDGAGGTPPFRVISAVFALRAGVLMLSEVLFVFCLGFQKTGRHPPPEYHRGHGASTVATANVLDVMTDARKPLAKMG